tara:strand:- start:2917 stop:3174 length:258 start_codon:yes stop_codon:yes gene_type:complete
MKNEIKCILNAVLFSVVLNLVLPMVVAPFATKDEIMPPEGAASLSFKSQVMHMLVHHRQVPLASSVVVALIVGLSVYLGYMFKVF